MIAAHTTFGHPSPQKYTSSLSAIPPQPKFTSSTMILLIDAFLKVLDKLIDLARYREQHKKEFFNHIIEPSWKDFEAVHDNYLKTLRNYSDLINDKTKPITPDHEIFKSIDQDSLYTTNMRDKVAKLCSLVQSPFVGAYASAISNYLIITPRSFTFLLTGDEPNQNFDPARLRRCIPRRTLSDSLKFVANKDIRTGDQRELALKCVEEVTRVMQSSYHEVLSTYDEIKTKLFNKKTD